MWNSSSDNIDPNPTGLSSECVRPSHRVQGRGKGNAEGFPFISHWPECYLHQRLGNINRIDEVHREKGTRMNIEVPTYSSCPSL